MTHYSIIIPSVCLCGMRERRIVIIHIIPITAPVGIQTTPLTTSNDSDLDTTCLIHCVNDPWQWNVQNKTCTTTFAENTRSNLFKKLYYRVADICIKIWREREMGVSQKTMGSAVYVHCFLEVTRRLECTHVKFAVHIRCQMQHLFSMAGDGWIFLTVFWRNWRTAGILHLCMLCQKIIRE